MQGIRQAGKSGRMSAADGQARETDWMRIRVAHGLPATLPKKWKFRYSGLTQEDLEILAAIL